MLGTSRAYVIAEAGVNHNGSLARALEMVDVAADAGADCVKFQTFKAEKLVSAHARKAAYQVINTGADDGQLGMLKQLELDEAAHRSLADRCAQRNIGFMSTAFDLQSLQFLSTLSMPATKVPSGDLTAAPLVLAAARAGRPIILSTGMCTIDEIEQALGVIAFGLTTRGDPPDKTAFARAFQSERGQIALVQNVVLLHCVTNYPASLDEVNLRAMDVLRERFKLPIGYSDHTLGTTAAVAAVARGACVLEKHFTLDRKLPGPDHVASLEPGELKAMIALLRNVETALGKAIKEPTPAEVENRKVARRSLVAARDIVKGELFSEANLIIKRPGVGRAPVDYWDVLGTPANRDYAHDEVIDS